VTQSRAHGPASAAPPLELAVVGLLFTLSGAAALVYQVAWQRILALHSGVGIYSVAIIVASFMAGLGIGSHLGGVASRRVTPARALRLFALIELGIGLFAAASPMLYYDILYLKAAWLYEPLWRAAICHLAALIVPTTLMGMSLPFLVRAMVRDSKAAGRTIGLLYGVNVIGASLGALVTPWLLMRHLGIASAIFCGVLCNALAGLGALALVGRVREEEGPLADLEAPAAPADQRPDSHAFALWLALYATSGFCALSLEILWFRLIDVAVKSTAFTFGTVLSIYLLGLAAGSLWGARRVARLHDPLRAFLLLQCALIFYSGLVVLILASLTSQWPGMAWFFEYWRGRDGFRLGSIWDAGAILRLYVALPVALYGLPTVLMGVSFAVLQRAVHDDPKTSGFKVGVLQAANIAGCVAGSLLVGLVGLTWLGTPGTLRVLLALGGTFGLLGLRFYGVRSPFALAVPALAVLAWLLPAPEALWQRLHGGERGVSYFGEDASGVIALTPDPGDRWRMSVNGRSISALPFGGMHSQLGAIPSVIHPAPRSVAIIGLGSGDTAWAAGCRSPTQSVTVFEICAPQLALLRRLADVNPPAKLRRFLRDKRFSIVFADGRNALERDNARYDVIETDATFPYSAYSGNLYSAEFFQACARRLNPGGVMCTWAPTPRVYATFCRAFPHVMALAGGAFLVGSNEPLMVDVPGWRARLVEPSTFGYLGEDLFHEVLDRLETAKAANPPDLEPNRDLFPRDEFRTPGAR
jgi:predicted membrane-bound spermidine synthase